MILELGMTHNSGCGLGIQDDLEAPMQVITIKAHGLQYQTMSREKFLRQFNRDLLVEQWVALVKFLSIAQRKDGNDPLAVSTLMKGINMKLKELEGKKMSELVDMYNELAKADGVAEVKKFKTLEAARIEVIKLANKKPPKTSAASADGKNTGGVEGRPRSGVGARSKELLKEGGSNKEVLEKIKAEFPDNSTTLACIAYYRAKLVKAGELKTTKGKKEEAKPVKGGKGKSNGGAEAETKPVKGKGGKKGAAAPAAAGEGAAA